MVEANRGHLVAHRPAVGASAQWEVAHLNLSRTTLGPTVEHRRSGFDADALATALRDSGYPNPEWFEPESAEQAATEYEQMAQAQH
jgi:hypothetical protein